MRTLESLALLCQQNVREQREGKLLWKTTQKLLFWFSLGHKPCETSVTCAPLNKSLTCFRTWWIEWGSQRRRLKSPDFQTYLCPFSLWFFSPSSLTIKALSFHHACSHQNNVLNFWSNLASHSPASVCFLSESREESFMRQVTTGGGWHFHLRLKPQVRFGLDEKGNLQGSTASQRC